MKKIQGLLVFLIVSLSIYLAYDIYLGGDETENPVELKLEEMLGEELLEKFRPGETIDREASADTYETEEITETKEETETETQKETFFVDESEEDTTPIPAAYDSRTEGKAPKLRNQGQLGTCWAVATSSAVEASLLPEENLLFSVDHISLQHGYNQTQAQGGSSIMAMAYLTSWKGPVMREDDPYGDGVSPEGLEPVKHVQEAQMPSSKDYEQIKRAVMKHGAVQTSMYMDMQGAQTTSPYYNENTWAYCYTGTEGANHDVLIIGWDDNYDASNFKTPAVGNGAFICQNSWGEYYGNQGILYISYEDMRIGENNIVYTRVDNPDNYDHIYQTDLCGWVGQIGYEEESSYFANVYESNGNQTVSAVGFYATDENTEYEIYSVEKFHGAVSFLGRKSLQKGKLRNAGFYTIDLQKPFEVEKGQEFAMVVKVTTPGADYPVAAEYQAGEATKTVDITDGKGYISYNGMVWSGTEEDHECNVCLKVYTKDKK